MGIKGLTDRQAQFPEIGKIRKGGPKEKNKPGPDLDHFRVEFDEAEDDARATFFAAYGDKPKQLNVLLPFNRVDENFEAWKEAYVQGGMTHRCDGEKILYDIDKDKLIADCDGSSGCKPVGRLKVLIPELKRLAFLTSLTGSIHDIMNISRQLDALLKINGRLAGVPLILSRKPVPISTPSGPDGKRARRVKSLLSIEANPTWVALKLDELQIAALPTVENLPLLEAPEIIETEIEIIPGEDDLNDDPPPPSPPENLENGERPYPPETIKNRMNASVEKYKGARKSDKMLEMAVWQLNECFAGDDNQNDKRRSVLAYLFDKDSAKDLSGAEMKSVIQWLDSSEDSRGDFLPSFDARAEANQIVTQRIKEQGQQELL